MFIPPNFKEQKYFENKETKNKSLNSQIHNKNSFTINL